MRGSEWIIDSSEFAQPAAAWGWLDMIATASVADDGESVHANSSRAVPLSRAAACRRAWSAVRVLPSQKPPDSTPPRERPVAAARPIWALPLGVQRQREVYGSGGRGVDQGEEAEGHGPAVTVARRGGLEHLFAAYCPKCAPPTPSGTTSATSSRSRFAAASCLPPVRASGRRVRAAPQRPIRAVRHRPGDHAEGLVRHPPAGEGLGDRGVPTSPR